jgi:hypothetical protein
MKFPYAEPNQNDNPIMLSKRSIRYVTGSPYTESTPKEIPLMLSQRGKIKTSNIRATFAKTLKNCLSFDAIHVRKALLDVKKPEQKFSGL